MNTLTVQRDLIIADLKKQFNQLYPYLKLEFFSSEHEANQGSPKKDLIKDSTLLSEVGVRESKELVLPPQINSTDLEEQFKADFGANVQVFWKSGRVWLETINHDDLPLTELNRHAKERTEHIV